MKLAAVVDSLDAVPEQFRELYSESTINGETAYVLQIDGARSHPDVLALSNAHDRSKKRVRELDAEVVTLKEKVGDLPDDFDPDLYQRAVDGTLGGGNEPKDAEEIRRVAAEGATKRAEEKAKKEHDKLAADRDKYKGIAETQVRKLAVDAALDENNISGPYRAGARALLMPLVVVHEEDGELVALAKDPAVGDTIPVAEHVKAWAGTEEGKAYVSARESAGGGANGGGKGNALPDKTVNPWKPDTMNLTEQARLKTENPDLAAKLMREAGVPVSI